MALGESQDAYQQVYQQPQEQHESSFGHELIAGGAAFAGFKAFEDHQRNEGKPVSHQFAKELLAGFAGAEVDKLAETKGMDEYDRERAKHQARENSQHMYDQHYGNQNEYDPNNMGRPERIQQQFGGGDLDEDLIPEWKTKYFDYRVKLPLTRSHLKVLISPFQQGKKRIKAIVRVYRSANRPLHTPSVRSQPSGGLRHAPRSVENHGSDQGVATDSQRKTARQDERPAAKSRTWEVENASADSGVTVARAIPGASIRGAAQARGDAEQIEGPDGRTWTQYGSIQGTPPPVPPKPPALELPEPALESTSEHIEDAGNSRHTDPPGTYGTPNSGPLESAGSAYEVGATKPVSASPRSLVRRHTYAMKAQNAKATRRDRDRPLLKRIFSRGSTTLQGSPVIDIPLEVVEAIDSREKDLWRFCERELDKIEKFYKAKEDEAGEMLATIQEQLHTLRDQHMREKDAEAAIKLRQKREEKARQEGFSPDGHRWSPGEQSTDPGEHRNRTLSQSVDMIYHPIQVAKHVTFHRPSGKGPLATPPGRDRARSDDFERTIVRPEVSYRYAKRKLKVALFDFYRSLDLLKSYCILNEKAFRKLNKKYDKAVHARLPMWFMSKHVNGAYFVRSSVLDAHFNTVEDLYSRYFEKGNRKTAVGKLRARPIVGTHGLTILFNGFLFAAGLVLGIQSLVSAHKLLFSADRRLEVLTSYLLQIYAGYFLMLLLFLYFCIDCWIFTRAKVNYVFIFEFDTRHNLDWRELFELPCLFFLFLGLTMYLNFTLVDVRIFFVYWPCVLLGATAWVIFFPFPILYHHSRGWLLESCARLLPAGFLKVNFRDFFLGDMFCSLAYSLGNIELFFCLYANDWDNPNQCNSTHSRLLGFFTAVPGIIRFLQCIRRYIDTRHAFPHLANCAKYLCTILYYMSLSLYRINDHFAYRALFITCALLNALYCSFWDIFYDWSIGDLSAPAFGLRPNLAYKWRWTYYAATVFDVALRFNWIFYAVYAHDLQHSSLVAFFVGLSEVTRRGVWSLFRVENEHCTNVGRFRATPDIKLPYAVSRERLTLDNAHAEDYEVNADGANGDDGMDSARLTPRQATATGADLEQAVSRGSTTQSIRRRSGLSSGRPRASTAPSTRGRVGTLLHDAHAQDFERRKKPEEPAEDDDDDDDEDDQEDDDEEYRKALEDEAIEAAVEHELHDEPRSPLITAHERLQQIRSRTSQGG
ncbi:MAG: hypothetical protein M1828_000460 [Chrysothrix sp. TS-e1954]|nr:MAG: hypothetical protein M1828_000460 [Chrysothrix sp. TS-e1954]